MNAPVTLKPKTAARLERPTVEELLQRARALVPTLRKRGAESDGLRRLPKETLDEFIEAGFHLIGTPREFGGMGYVFDRKV